MEQGFNLTYNVTFINNFTQEASSIKTENYQSRQMGESQPYRKVLGNLFKALLCKLMTREIRAADLDLSAL